MIVNSKSECVCVCVRVSCVSLVSHMGIWVSYPSPCKNRVSIQLVKWIIEFACGVYYNGKSYNHTHNNQTICKQNVQLSVQLYTFQNENLRIIMICDFRFEIYDLGVLNILPIWASMFLILFLKCSYSFILMSIMLYDAVMLWWLSGFEVWFPFVRSWFDPRLSPVVCNTFNTLKLYSYIK
jgi:hypothetical protein